MIGWRIALAAGLLGLVLAVLGVSRYQVAEARAETAEAREQSAQLRAALDAQSAEVERWRRKTNDIALRAAQAQREAQAQRRNADDAAARLRAFSPAGMGECDALRALVDLAR